MEAQAHHLFHTCPACGGRGTLTTEELAALLPDGDGKVGRAHPETSRRAAKAAVKFGTQRWRVLDVLVRVGPSTAREVGDSLGLSPNQAATRVMELREAGLVKYQRDDDGQRVERETTPGNTGFVHRATSLGRATWDAARPR